MLVEWLGFCLFVCFRVKYQSYVVLKLSEEHCPTVLALCQGLAGSDHPQPRQEVIGTRNTANQLGVNDCQTHAVFSF